MYSFAFSEIDPTFQREKLQLSAISPAVFNFSREPYSRKPHFAAPSDVYLPLYLRLVASPPLMCRSALLRSSRVRTCRYSAGLMRGRRSVRSLCTVVTNKNVFIKPEITEELEVNIYISVFIDLDFLHNLF